MLIFAPANQEPCFLIGLFREFLQIQCPEFRVCVAKSEEMEQYLKK